MPVLNKLLRSDLVVFMRRRVPIMQELKADHVIHSADTMFDIEFWPKNKMIDGRAPFVTKVRIDYGTVENSCADDILQTVEQHIAVELAEINADAGDDDKVILEIRKALGVS